MSPGEKDLYKDNVLFVLSCVYLCINYINKDKRLTDVASTTFITLHLHQSFKLPALEIVKDKCGYRQTFSFLFLDLNNIYFI